MWKYLFQEHILGRGIDYFIRNLVENVYIKDNMIEATVYGTEEYKVEIIKKDEEVMDLSCNCPYADAGNNCKHMAAVLFYLEDKENILVGQDIEDSIGKLVEEADDIIIKEFLINALKNDEKLLNRFKSSLQCDISPADMRRYKNQVNNIFWRFAGRHDFVDYKNARGFISELEEILDNDIQAMIDNNQFKEAFGLTNYIFIKVGNQDMDDSDGGTGVIANRCLEIWQEILDNCSIDFKKDMYKWFIEHMDGSVIDYMEDYIEQVLFEDFKEEEFIQNKLLYLDDKIKEYKEEGDSWLRDYKLGQLTLRHIEILEEMNISQKEIDKYCRDNLEINEVRKYYIDICIKRKDYHEAIALLKEIKDQEKDWPGLLNKYSLKLKDLYKEIGEKELYEEELWLLVLNYKAGDVELYKELKSIYTDKEWLEKREIIFSKLAPYSGIAKFYEIEGLYDRLLDLVINYHGLSELIQYEKVLKDIYPNELINRYEVIVRAMATDPSGRAHYRELVSILRRMEKYPVGKERVSEIVSDWESRYRNRPAMMDELSKL